MQYNLGWLIDLFEKKNKFKYLFFWGHQPAKDGQITASCFSQWWVSPFVVNGIQYKSAEHWMMARKAILFNDQEVLERIIKTKTPAEAKKLGRLVKNFDERIWLEKRYSIVLEGTLNKFAQHKELKEFLIQTGSRILVEASPVDRIWGIGLAADDERAQNPKRWNGLNLLGFALMEARDILGKE